MNKRIKELFGQAMDQSIPETWTTLTHSQLSILKDKFAELIVRECTEQVWYTREDGINGNISQVIKDRIKEHFGVKS